MREILNLHIGHAGVRMGSEIWEIFAREHEVNPDGSLQVPPSDEGFATFFESQRDGQTSARALLIDTDDEAIDSARKSSYGQLIPHDNLVAGREDASNCYARGRYVVGPPVVRAAFDAIRRAAESCTALQGFIIYASVAGGTGSGSASHLYELLADGYPKTSKLQFLVWPSVGFEAGPTEAYNATCALPGLMDYLDVCTFLENQSLYQVYAHGVKNSDIRYPEINSIIGQAVSSLTASLRFEGVLNCDLQEFQTNLVPYPRIHFMTASYAPYGVGSYKSHQTQTGQITLQAFEKEAALSSVPLDRGLFFACCLMYRGDVHPKDVHDAIFSLKHGGQFPLRFVDWSPTGFKVGLNSMPMISRPAHMLVTPQRSVCLMANSSAARWGLKRNSWKFDQMFAKRAFLHWYVGEGMEISEMLDARYVADAIVEDYRDCLKEIPGF